MSPRPDMPSPGLEVPFDLGLVRKAPGFEVPDIDGTVEGWRAWTVLNELPPYGLDPKMHSVTHHGYTWYPKQAAESECDRINAKGETHTPGDARCGCGFYSAKSLRHLMELGYHSYGDYDDARFTKVVGRVANWGQVTEGTQGWRSQYSYPVMLFVPYESAHLGKPLMKAFGCKVRLLNFLKRPGELSQLAAVQGKYTVPTAEPVKHAGRKCRHLKLPFSGHVSGEPFQRDGAIWVEVRWDARPDSPVNMRVSNLVLARRDEEDE
jgi:hypothetical protein